MDLINKPDSEDLPPPKPWEERPISAARWRKHRDTMLRWAYPGSRPQEWWVYEKQMQRPAHETRYLFDAGELSGAELNELRPHWREKYDHAWQLNFAFNAGTSGWLEGAAARKAWYRLFGIPDAIIKRWDEERRRSAKTVTLKKISASL